MIPRSADTEWELHADGTETRWRSGMFLTVNLHADDGAWQWTVTDGEPDGQPVRAAMLTRMGRDVAKRDAEETADELAEIEVAEAACSLPDVEPRPGWEERVIAACAAETELPPTHDLGEGG